MPRVRKGQPSCPWEVLLYSRGRGKPWKSLKLQKNPPCPLWGGAPSPGRSLCSEGCCGVQAASLCLRVNRSLALPAKLLTLLTLSCSSGGNFLPSCLLLGSTIARSSKSHLPAQPASREGESGPCDDPSLSSRIACSPPLQRSGSWATFFLLDMAFQAAYPTSRNT